MAEPLCVRVEGKSIRFPRLCVHCLAPATAERKISKSQSRGRRRVTRSVKVPYCDACLDLAAYEAPKERLIKRIGIVSVIVISGTLIGLGVALNEVQDWIFPLAFLLGLASPFFLYPFVFRRWAETYVEPQMRRRRAQAQLAIVIHSFDREGTVFQILNPGWARRFAESNDSIIQQS